MDSDIVIVGGGLNGSILALSAAQAGLTVALVDARTIVPPETGRFDGRAYALALASQRMLCSLGLWKDLASHAQPITEIMITDGRAGKGSGPFGLYFDDTAIDDGPMGYMVEDRHLSSALGKCVAGETGVSVVAGEAVVGQELRSGGVMVALAGGGTVSGRLLVGADGKRGGVAERAGIARAGWEYSQTALVCAVVHERSHGGVAHQFFMPAGPLAILPLTGNRSSVVWCEAHGTAKRIHGMATGRYLSELRLRFGDFLGKLELVGDRVAFPLALSVAESFVGSRLALVGDAAHGIHPIAGQGLNAGLRDVAALAEVLADAARRGEDIAASQVLARYEQWRRFDSVTLALTTDAINRLFSNDNGWLRLGRGLGLGLVNAMPDLRCWLTREAAGLTGDIPRLLRGHSI